MSQDCFPEPKTGPAPLPSEVNAARLEKPDMEMLVKKAVGAYYQQVPPSASFPPSGFGDPSLFKVVAKSLEPPKWAFLGTAALAAAPGGLVLLLYSYVSWKRIPIPPNLSLYAEGVPYVVFAGIVMFVAIRSRGGSIISYAMGALAGGVLIASIFAAQIIKQNTSQPGTAPVEGQKQHAAVVVNSVEEQRVALSR